jgi:hypothetical protein
MTNTVFFTFLVLVAIVSLGLVSLRSWYLLIMQMRESEQRRKAPRQAGGLD